ncbi:tRNA (guanosine(37)-N1)-methyltransferase TrmD [Pseudoteredinibacter isoporae]|uniref:tRNA (guanine-N(1)-)-methyltransferase n=1 Tax=Pseudoteredinibacter isoporae TaxID=570281 RepID=A0A7X0JXG0_9GAMM|nr:tRNA (guanosine(37)-N1)-methyltransferase TrmD [Pseudoteredinibacter isoporae]MBB6523300.1 tRNA (guanine37-N1)-methyltransferase [Pseudoteredinibacter isoporae]NHO88814.1 tRNA (guanosine(37)-N1)-methyltransferase TrmD [Pseudoteredinibacter isoporae]NIB24478.1 tRNA (guanosine(37)-N1)-methyltransferase TrmD [Pseudoteredinibacter isoporae]
MRIAVVTLFPEMFDAVSRYGVSGRACEQGVLDLRCFNPRSHTSDRHQTVDDRPYGGGPGMLMMIQPLSDAIEEARQWAESDGKSAMVVYLSPQGKVFDQSAAKHFAAPESGNLVLLAGRYEGVDERLIQAQVDAEWSIGDYVLSGGELAAMVMLDAVTRLLPGALGHQQSAEQDSFSDGLLDCPHYTRPEVFQGESVPAVLLSGNHEKIRQWRLKQSLGRTWQRRPDLLEKLSLNEEQQKLLAEFKADLETS